jgi:hypothetical protein
LSLAANSPTRQRGTASLASATAAAAAEAAAAAGDDPELLMQLIREHETALAAEAAAGIGGAAEVDELTEIELEGEGWDDTGPFRLSGAKNAPFFSTFPMSVPSLSWQNDRLYI